MGQLHKVDLRGRTNQIVEVELLLGRDSDCIGLNEVLKKKFRYQVENPWLFCAERSYFDEIERLVGRYVVIEYKTPRKSSLIKCKGQNELIAIYPVNKNGADIGSYQSKTFSLGKESSGITVGRIVNAVKSGKHSVTYQIILQEGNSGNKFTIINIADDGLFDFSVTSLKAANKVKIYYIERFVDLNIKWGDAGIYVWKVETLDDI